MNKTNKTWVIFDHSLHTFIGQWHTRESSGGLWDTSPGHTDTFHTIKSFLRLDLRLHYFPAPNIYLRRFIYLLECRSFCVSGCTSRKLGVMRTSDPIPTPASEPGLRNRWNRENLLSGTCGWGLCHWVWWGYGGYVPGIPHEAVDIICLGLFGLAAVSSSWRLYACSDPSIHSCICKLWYCLWITWINNCTL